MDKDLMNDVLEFAMNHNTQEVMKRPNGYLIFKELPSGGKYTICFHDVVDIYDKPTFSHSKTKIGTCTDKTFLKDLKNTIKYNTHTGSERWIIRLEMMGEKGYVPFRKESVEMMKVKEKLAKTTAELIKVLKSLNLSDEDIKRFIKK
jgi:hypothetical protein